MATAILPIAVAALPQVLPLVVRLIDKIFPPKSGSAKLDAATEIAAAIQQGLQNSKALAGTPLSGDQLKAAVQSVVDAMNKSGELQGAATVIEAASPILTALADFMLNTGTILKGIK